jgi:uncharacterized cofD-like protein
MRPTSIRMWLRPGMSVKRWAALLVVGVLLASLSLAMGIAWAYRTHDLPDPITRLVQVATLQAVPHPARGLLLFALGAALLLVAAWKTMASLVVPLVARAPRSVAEIVAEHRFGPATPALRVVVVGGGSGLSNLLGGLKRTGAGITAVVTVTDDGGSTGRLRTDFDMPAPGDIRNCIVALSDAESTVGRLFDYRFERESATLGGHSFGNLFIAALTQVTGDFEQAVTESGRVLATRGRVLPTTVDSVRLGARLSDGSVVLGETEVSRSRSRIERIFLEPRHAPAHGAAVEALLGADLIVLGPGSLYTSVLPNLVVDGVRDAIRRSAARTVYVCNVATQRGETDGFDVADHVRAIVAHLGEGTLDLVLADGGPAAASRAGGVSVIASNDGTVAGVPLMTRDLVDPADPTRHHAERLADALVALVRRPRLASQPSPRRRTA